MQLWFVSLSVNEVRLKPVQVRKRTGWTRRYSPVAHGQGGNIKVQNEPSVCQRMPVFGSRLPHSESSTTRRWMPRRVRGRITSEAWMDKEIAAVLYERMYRDDMTSMHYDVHLQLEGNHECRVRRLGKIFRTWRF